MTREERKLALYCLKANSDLHGEVCEECSQYPECDHFIQDNVMEKLIEALEQESIIDVSSVPHKIAEFFSDWDGDKNAKMEISVNDMREIAFVYTKKARIERQLKKVLEQEPCKDAISRQEVIETLKELEWRYNGHPGGEVYSAIYKLSPVQPKILACGEGELNVPDINDVKLSETPTGSDCISRADVEQTVEDNILCYTHSDKPMDQDPDTECHMAIRTALRMLRKDLRKLPPVQPKPKMDVLDKIRAEIGKSKTEHEMQIAEKDIKAKLLISDIYCDIVNILDKYKS